MKQGKGIEASLRDQAKYEPSGTMLTKSDFEEMLSLMGGSKNNEPMVTHIYLHANKRQYILWNGVNYMVFRFKWYIHEKNGKLTPIEQPNFIQPIFADFDSY